MVHRIYVEKRENAAAAALLSDLRGFAGIQRLTGLRLINRYDIEHITEETLALCVQTVFSEPPLDNVYDRLPAHDGTVFAVESLPGQFDQRADSAAQCVQLASQGERPLVRCAKVYLLSGALTDEDIEAVKRYVINPVECREASLALPETLALAQDPPKDVRTLTGFNELTENELRHMLSEYGLAMDLADLAFCQRYFIGEKRNPTMTELRMIDTYWSDHCRHTTFLTRLENVTFEDADAQEMYNEYLRIRQALGRSKPVTLMDVATIGAKYLKPPAVDESEEINACTVRATIRVNGKDERWLLLFKNETHNHPTEIEPFGGAATCIGGAIRDPLSGRAYVYQAMRVTGAADPTRPVSETIPGKLPQRKLTVTAAAGYSSYGNQIGLATGQVDEWYHPGYAAKRLEIGAVVGAVPESLVRREQPIPGDVVILLGGRTGRDGCGGATGSSKSHTKTSLASCGAEVQKGNAPEERKLQRLLRNPAATRLIKRCNDFGAGGVSVAVGELADGLRIDLDAVPKKYEGLDGTELAISESQERMAVVLDARDEQAFLALANAENLEATRVATVTAEKRLVMLNNGREIVSISRDFLNSNGAPKTAEAHVPAQVFPRNARPASFCEGMTALASDLNFCSKRGLAERFDSTIGAGSVFMPFGGKRQLTPAQVMAAYFPVGAGRHTDDCSVMAYGMNPYATEQSPFHGAYMAVIESVAKLVAAGADYKGAHLTFQEYFERMRKDNWHKPLAALLGALKAQLTLGLAAIGGKDSMSGNFETLSVPPTLCSFAVTAADARALISPEFKRPGSRVRIVRAGDDIKSTFDTVARLIAKGKVASASAIGYGGAAGAVFSACLGNKLGFAFDARVDADTLFDWAYGAFVLETNEEIGEPLGMVTSEYSLTLCGDTLSMDALEALWADRLEDVFPTKAGAGKPPEAFPAYTRRAEARPAAKVAKPRVLIPVFPGTNCEYDTENAFVLAGAHAEIFVINNLTSSGVQDSAERFAKALEAAQILFLPGGFSGGDEPDGSGKFITAFLRNPRIAEQVEALLDKRLGLIGGICNGFQALIKLGLLPYGRIVAQDKSAPTLTYNTLGRHASRLVRTKVTSLLSPWLSLVDIGDVHTAPISHGEGRLICEKSQLLSLAQNGQIATQYVDFAGEPSMVTDFCPNGADWAVEGITSPDGRVFGRMAHAERVTEQLYRNVPHDGVSPMFESAVRYFK